MLIAGLLVVVFLVMLAVWLWWPTKPRRDYVAEMKQINADLNKQIVAFWEFEKVMARLYKKMEDEGEVK